MVKLHLSSTNISYFIGIMKLNYFYNTELLNRVQWNNTPPDSYDNAKLEILKKKKY